MTQRWAVILGFIGGGLALIVVLILLAERGMVWPVTVIALIFLGWVAWLAFRDLKFLFRFLWRLILRLVR